MNVSCDVITDLMVVYESGEASSDTRRLVEEHLRACPVCRKAYAGRFQVEVAAPPPAPSQKAERRFVLRTRRLFFGVASGALLLFAVVLAIIQRAAIQLEMPNLPGAPTLWALVGLAGLALEAALAIPALNRKRSLWEYLGLLAGMGVASVFGAQLLAAAPILWAFAGLALLLTTQALVLLTLGRARYLSFLAIAALVLANGFLSARPFSAIFNGMDFSGLSLTNVEALTIPPVDGGLEENLALDLTDLNLTLEESSVPTEISGAATTGVLEALQNTYSGAANARVSALRFADTQSAHDFFNRWEENFSGNLRVGQVENHLKDGQFVRAYNPAVRMAVSSWQKAEWVVVITVEGDYSPAASLARQLKERLNAAWQ